MTADRLASAALVVAVPWSPSPGRRRSARSGARRGRGSGGLAGRRRRAPFRRRLARSAAGPVPLAAARPDRRSPSRPGRTTASTSARRLGEAVHAAADGVCIDAGDDDQDLRQARRAPPRRRLCHRLRRQQRARGQGRRPGPARRDHRQVRRRAATRRRPGCISSCARTARRSTRCATWSRSEALCHFRFRFERSQGLAAPFSIRRRLRRGGVPAAQGARDARPPAPDATPRFWQRLHDFKDLSAQICHKIPLMNIS